MMLDYFFFFQAEDGIRDADVTGVQTCALPISAQLHTTGSVTFAGITGCSGGLQTGGSGQVSCLVSSRQFKNIAGDLAPNVALANVMALRPRSEERRVGKEGGSGGGRGE